LPFGVNRIGSLFFGPQGVDHGRGYMLPFSGKAAEFADDFF